VVDILRALISVVVGISVFVGILMALYWLSGRLPKRWQDQGRVVVFVGPALILLVIGLVIPALRTMYLSLFTGIQTNHYGGLANYRTIFSSPDMRIVLRNNVLWVVIGTTFSTGFGLMVARFADRMRGESVAKALIFLPTAISFVGAGVIWNFVYAPPTANGKQIGLLNGVVQGVGGTPKSWLLLTPWNTLMLIVVMIWIQAGFATVVFSAAIKGVPEALLEAARIDGATERQVFFRIVLPSIRTTIVTVVTTTVIAVLKVFDIVKAMTGGNFDTSVIANEVYQKSFVEDAPGYGSALAVLLFLAVVPVVYVNFRNQKWNRELSR
jgi:alpha-glucoside transport system permease protein